MSTDDHCDSSDTKLRHDVSDTRLRHDVSDHVPLTDYTVIQETLTGTVKWFNNKAGFGFITVCEEGEYKEKDIFIHYSSIRVSNLQYKYLVQGEYVDFTLVKANSDTHEFQAMNVSGVKGGPIMCETRRTMVQTPGNSGFSIPTVNRRNMRDTTGSMDEVHNRRQIQTGQEPKVSHRNQISHNSSKNPRADIQPRPPRREPRPVIDREPKTPREPSSTMNGDDLLGFTKVTKKRANKSNTHIPKPPKPSVP